MWSKPVRYQHQRCLHFITFSCYRRMQLLASAQARDVFERELARVRKWYGLCVVGYVVMPEHVHLLVSEPETQQSHGRDSDAETDHVTEAAPEASSSVLAGSLLRFSRLDRAKAHREIALYSSESSEPLPGRMAGGLGVEQFSSVGYRARRHG
jgi:hypothetical protein